MRRRKFIQWTVVGGLSFVAMPLYAEKLWVDAKKTTLSEVLEKMFGKRKITPSDKIVLKVPQIATNRASVPISITSEIEAKKVIVLSEEDKEQIIGIFDVPKDTIVDFYLKGKFPSSDIGTRTIWVILEDMEGNLYSNSKSFEAALTGGCEG